MRVLIACEYSGRVRDAFSCDILPTDSPGPHYQGDVFDLDLAGFDLLIAHPPCTYLCNSGVRWLHERPNRWPLMRDGAEFFKRLLDAPVSRVAVENPVMHKYAKEIIGRGHDFSVQPWQFGDPAKKRTCFWTRGLSPLKPTSDMTAKDARPDVHRASPGPNRWKIRSTTYHGIARGMAEQWGI